MFLNVITQPTSSPANTGEFSQYTATLIFDIEFARQVMEVCAQLSRGNS